MSDGRGYPIQLRSAVCRRVGVDDLEGQSSDTDNLSTYQRVAAKSGLLAIVIHCRLPLPALDRWAQEGYRRSLRGVSDSLSLALRSFFCRRVRTARSRHRRRRTCVPRRTGLPVSEFKGP